MLAVPLRLPLFETGFCSSAKNALALSELSLGDVHWERAWKQWWALIFSLAIFSYLYCPAACLAQSNGLANHPLPPSSQDPSKEVTQVVPSADSSVGGKIILKPGQPLSIGMQTEDLVPTDDIELARRQATAYPDNPEASFILAVALTRTSRVEEALKEVRRARKLADSKGGPAYFDHMIETYEKMLTYCPEDNRIRYGLAWAYYMKAYLLAQNSKKLAKLKSVQNPAQAVTGMSTAPSADVSGGRVSDTILNATVDSVIARVDSRPPDQNKGHVSMPHIEGALEKAAPDAVPQIKRYYESALKNLDDLLARKPDDVWAKVYRAHLNAEYTGNLEESMAVWRSCQTKHPENPAPYFFLGEGYLRQGNLKECLHNISRAIALRAIGN